MKCSLRKFVMANVVAAAAAVEHVVVAADVVNMGRVAATIGLVGTQQMGQQWTHPHQELCQCRTHWHS